MRQKIAVLVGSIRRDSINRTLAKALIKLAPKDLACEFFRIDDLPVFNQDNDQNSPAPVTRVKSQIEASDALLFVTPEHNRPLPTARIYGLASRLEWWVLPSG
jgi:chromate reductase, NAD(P)H dehydrogenase (quinone)